MAFSFAWTRVRADRVSIAGRSAQASDGPLIGPFGKVPSDVSLDAAQAAARSTGQSILGSLNRELGGLDRVFAWLMVYGMVKHRRGPHPFS
jgi:hypothetical protein